MYALSYSISRPFCLLPSTESAFVEPNPGADFRRKIQILLTDFTWAETNLVITNSRGA